MAVTLDSERGAALKRKESPTHVSWRKMRERCSLKSSRQWPWYGGRGIKVCDRWQQSFDAFLEDMGERPEGMTLDRIDPDGDYTPQNCRWADSKTQSRNARHVIWVEHRGERVILRELCEDAGVPWMRVYQRLRAGWPVDAAISEQMFKKLSVVKKEPMTGAKLTAEQVLYIRGSRLRVRDLAAEFGVSVGCIAKVRYRESYQHIPEMEAA